MELFSNLENAGVRLGAGLEAAVVCPVGRERRAGFDERGGGLEYVWTGDFGFGGGGCM